MASIRVGVAGATGWTGRVVAQVVIETDGLELVSAVSRSAAGRDLGEAWGEVANGVVVSGSVPEALDGIDVLVDYTRHDVARAHALTAIERGVGVVIGTSGLTAGDFEVIGRAADERGVGVVAAGNFSITAAMAQAAALLVAPYLPNREIIDYASETKPDAPSGTARELAERLGEVNATHIALPVEETGGLVATRGGDVAGTRVHSLRLPSFVLSTEAVFALPDERLVIRHDAGPSAQPYVAGTLLAIRAVVSRVGLVRGLDRLLLN
jgi:4-hydroxy-tetrahydrodipicolinate reductase